jgi:hypothetical protein
MPTHETCRQLVDTAATRIATSDVPPGHKHWIEADLQRFMFEAGGQLLSPPGRAMRNFRAPIPGWWPGAGDIDLVVEHALPRRRRFDLYELKWCNHNKMEEALWDIVKMSNAHGLSEVRHTYLVFAAPERCWAHDIVGAACFEPGRHSLRTILKDHPKRWIEVLKGGTGRPIDAADGIRIDEVFECALDLANGTYRLKAVAVRPVGEKRFRVPQLEVDSG